MVKAPVTQLTKWVSFLTYPQKPNDTSCTCFNPRDPNKAIIWEHYKAPTLDKISYYLSRTPAFSKLNTKDGFWSVHLDEKSSYLTTFDTHKGRYWFLHMPFTLKMSLDIFQMCMDQVTDHLPGIITIHDDICIYGQTPEQYNRHLIQLMQTALKNRLAFTSSKFKIKQPQISFYCTVFTSQGMKPLITRQNFSPFLDPLIISNPSSQA